MVTSCGEEGSVRQICYGVENLIQTAYAAVVIWTQNVVVVVVT